MSSLLLDTTFLIDTERGNRIDRAIGDDDDIAIASVTLAELLLGVRLASGKKKASRRTFVAELIRSVPIIPYDARVAVEHADLMAAVRRQGRPRGAHDLMIAATARASGRSVVTADRRAFIDLPGVAVAGYR